MSNGNNDGWEDQSVEEMRTMGRRAQPAAPSDEVPDGSAFATASSPLPKNHWLYAPRGAWDNERDDFVETPRPVLTNAQREAVIAASRYAIRGATMCGQEQDFDPDAMVQNIVYALCGPATGSVLPADAAPPVAPEPVAWTTLIEIDWVKRNAGRAGSFYAVKAGPNDIPLFAHPPRAPLTEEQKRDLVKECDLDWQRGFMPLFDGDPTNRYAVLIEAVEAAHGIGGK